MECPVCSQNYNDAENFCPNCGKTKDNPVAMGWSLGALICGIISLAYPLITLFAQAAYYDDAYYYDYYSGGGIAGAIFAGMNIIGAALGILAIIIGNKARRQLPRNQRGMAVTGLALGIAGLAIWPVLLIMAFVMLAGLLTACAMGM